MNTQNLKKVKKNIISIARTIYLVAINLIIVGSIYYLVLPANKFVVQNDVNEQAIKEASHEINYSVYGKNNALIEAVIHHDKNIVLKLLENGANPNRTDESWAEARGKTPLILAIEHDKVDLIPLLIDWGAYVNHEVYNGMTPLLTAIQNKNIQAVKLLLKNGARVEQRSFNEGYKPLYMAKKTGNKKLLEILAAYK